MCFEVLYKFYSLFLLLPKLDMTITTCCDEKFCSVNITLMFGGYYNNVTPSNPLSFPHVILISSIVAMVNHFSDYHEYCPRDKVGGKGRGEGGGGSNTQEDQVQQTSSGSLI